MEIRSVGIVGYGAFGALAHTLLKRFVPAIEVRVYAPEKRLDGKTFFPLKDAASCDAVVLAVPIRQFETVLKKVVSLAPKTTVIVDIATVKMHTVSLLQKLARGRRYIATHPVWGPESYAKRGGDVSGFRIVVSEHTLPQSDFAALAAFLQLLGFDVVETSADAHDKHLAESLFLTHFIGQLVTHGGFSRSEVDTVSFGYLMDAVDIVKNDAELFQNVFRFNPHCKEVLRKLSKAELSVRHLLTEGEDKKNVVIGVSGVRGSFTEEATRVYIKKHKIKQYTLQYLVDSENVLAALESGEIDLGIFYIENSISGVVMTTVEAMSKHNFDILTMFDIAIKQNLLVRKGVSRKQIKEIRSQEPALQQCTAYLKREWPKAKIKSYVDTAKAAEDLANGTLPKTTAVIASHTAAEIYGLEVLDAAIQDTKTNRTTFIAAKAL